MLPNDSWLGLGTLGTLMRKAGEGEKVGVRLNLWYHGENTGVIGG